MKLKMECCSETVINKSRFIACAAPVRNEEEARAYIDAIRRRYPDATHVCTAYVVGDHNQIQRSSDNKEPAGTAGMPMLEAILSSGLSDTCVCVVRYFGGIKLGTGGLVRAYGGAVRDVLSKAAKVNEIPAGVYEITYPYNLSGTIEGYLRRCARITDTSYGEQVSCIFESTDPDIAEKLSNLTRGSVRAELIDHTKMEVDV